MAVQSVMSLSVDQSGRQETPGSFVVQEGEGCVLEWRLGWHGRSVGDGTDCRPERPTGDAWVVFDDNKVWAACWNGGWGGMANLVGDAQLSAGLADRERLGRF